MTSLPPGSKIGRFEITGILGEGAMGSVYLAHDPQIDRPVAIKILRVEGSGERAQEVASRFQKEARLAGRLQHPNIVTIYEAGRFEGIDFIAMEYVDGQPLNRFAESETGFSLSRRVEVVRQVALALEHAHERGVLHRDIKPGNILVTRDGGVKVADFGIGKLLTATVELTRTGQMIGSPAYMSPEQIRGEKLDGRSDFFSLGVVFYELLTGSRPFPGDTITTLVYQILHTEPRDPLTLRADLPPSAREVFARLLAKSPEKRPANAAEFLREARAIQRDLGEAERTQPVMVPADSWPEGAGQERAAAAPPGAALSLSQPGRTGSRGPALLFGGAAVVLAAALVVAVWRRTVGSPPPAVEPAVAVSPTAVPQPSPVPTLAATAVPTPAALPTRGPRAASDASVGAPRGAMPVTPGRRAPTLVERARVEPLRPPKVPERSEQPERGFSFDGVYRTRRYAKFGVSPDQARLYVDGRYVGIADDWDDRGGGKTLEFAKAGSHRVRLELPGYRTLNLEIIASPNASDETVDIGDDLKRESKVDYPKIPKVDDRTVGPVAFAVDPPDAAISEGGRVLGQASSFGPDSPLRLSGPIVHDLVITAPGRKSKTVRILVAGNADREQAKVKVELKKE